MSTLKSDNDYWYKIELMLKKYSNQNTSTEKCDSLKVDVFMVEIIILILQLLAKKLDILLILIVFTQQ
jgi:hypothetical protein